MKMKHYPKRQLIQLLALSATSVLMSLAIVLISNLPAYNQQVANPCRPQFVSPARGERTPGGREQEGRSSAVDAANLAENCQDSRNLVISPEAVLLQLAQANVVYLAETHDNPQDHQNQLEIIQELQKQNPKIAIAMEMFQRPYQDVLDRYLAGNLTEQELVQQTEYEQRWGFYWEYYAPILRFAKEKQLRVLALNTPTEVTRQVIREGLESLSAQQRRFVPPFSEIRTDNVEYRQMIVSAFKQHQQSGHGSSSNFERFFLAQVLWDETMAERIAQFVKAHPDYQVVVLAGQKHIVYGYGIPSRVQRRLRNTQLVQRSVLLSPPEGTVAIEQEPIADFVWQPH